MPPRTEPALAESPVNRILQEASRLLFIAGYNGLTMDALAHELGMSKKTLYTHFNSKDDIIAAVITAAGQAIRAEVEATRSDPALRFTLRLRKVMEIVGARWARLTPAILRELERFAPKIYRQLEDLKQHNIPLVIGALLRQGIDEGMVRADVDVDFAVQFWLQSLNGLLAPATLERLGLTPAEAFNRGIRLFFWALLTEAGRADFEETSKERSR